MHITPVETTLRRTRLSTMVFGFNNKSANLPWRPSHKAYIFRSNSKFDENSERSSFEYTPPITTIFCTRHDSDTVVTCAKYRCDRPRIFYTRGVLNFHWISSMKIQNALVSNILHRSQRYFAHVTTVTLSWRVQNIVVIGRVYFTLEVFWIFIEFRIRSKYA